MKGPAPVLDVRRLELEEVLEIRPPLFEDERGFFSEVWNSRVWREAGLDFTFVQENHSFSRYRGVLRGLHYQVAPHAQTKLVRVTRGSVFDVAVDIRRSSPNFGKWVSAIVSASDWNQLLIPEGFAHGFLTLEPRTEVQYRVTSPYSRDHDRAIRFDDPAIGVGWPVPADDLILSAKDQQAPLLAQADTAD